MRISDWSSDVCSSDLSQASGEAQDGAGVLGNVRLEQDEAHARLITAERRFANLRAVRYSEAARGGCAGRLATARRVGPDRRPVYCIRRGVVRGRPCEGWRTMADTHQGETRRDFLYVGTAAGCATGGGGGAQPFTDPLHRAVGC